MSWLDELEARLEQQLAAFLAANPSQEALLGEQEARDRQAQLVGQRRQLQRQAEQERQALLQLAAEIRCWQERVVKARAAGATALAERAGWRPLERWSDPAGDLSLHLLVTADS